MNLLGLHILLASLSCLSLAFPQNESALPDSYPSSAVDNSLHEKNEITHSSNSSDHYSSTIDLLEEEKKVNESTCISAAMKSPLCHRYVDERGHPLRIDNDTLTCTIRKCLPGELPLNRSSMLDSAVRRCCTDFNAQIRTCFKAIDQLWGAEDEEKESYLSIKKDFVNACCSYYKKELDKMCTKIREDLDKLGH